MDTDFTLSKLVLLLYINLNSLENCEEKIQSFFFHQGEIGNPGEQGEIGFKGDKVGHRCTCTEHNAHAHAHYRSSFSYHHIAFIIELLISDVIVLCPTQTLICLFVFDRAALVFRAYQASAGNQDHRLALALMVYFQSFKVTFSRRFIIKMSCIG